VSPQWGIRKCQLLATPCVALSLALFALGDSDLTGGFHLGTLSIGRPLSNHWANFVYGFRIPQCGGCFIRGVGVAHKLVFTAPFYSAYKGLPLCLLDCYVAGL
jgi:hypothetical protein